MRRIRKMLEWCIKHKVLVFVLMCFCVHTTFAGIFAVMRVWILAVLNTVSTVFYGVILLFHLEEKKTTILWIYYEIMIFAFLSELILGEDYGFCLYMFGMISVLFFLTTAESTYRIVHQLIGSGMIVLLYVCRPYTVDFFKGLRRLVVSYKEIFYFYNMVLTLATMMVLAFLYAEEINQVKKLLEYNTRHDPLTNLFNRRFLEEYLKNFKSMNGMKYVICMMDIDDFKKVNDTYGHDAGDKALVTVSNIVKSMLEEQDIAIRWGGEEFLLFIPTEDEKGAVALIEQVRQQVAKSEIICKGKSFKITLTAGVAFGSRVSDYEKVISKADEHLYAGKNNGKNQVHR